MSLDEIREDLLSKGIRSLTNYTEDRKPLRVRRVECSAGCGAHAEVRFQATDSVDYVIGQFFKKGWSIARRANRAFCPACSKENRRFPLGAEMKDAMRAMRDDGHTIREIAARLGISSRSVFIHSGKETSKETPQPQPQSMDAIGDPLACFVQPQEPPPEEPLAHTVADSPSAPLTVTQICSVISRLNLVFRDGRYARDWSDERIAHDASLLPEQVAQVRLESPDHGMIRTAPDVAALKADISAMEALFAEQIAELRSRLAPLEAAE
jgi:AraC-like DNA-binding protein